MSVDLQVLWEENQGRKMSKCKALGINGMIVRPRWGAIWTGSWRRQGNQQGLGCFLSWQFCEAEVTAAAETWGRAGLVEEQPEFVVAGLRGVTGLRWAVWGCWIPPLPLGAPWRAVVSENGWISPGERLTGSHSAKLTTRVRIEGKW